MDSSSSLNKVWRFVQIYGIGRTWFKIAGRRRSFAWLRLPAFRRSRKDIGVIGCGQFAFSTLGYVIGRHFGDRFSICFDTDAAKSASLARFLRVPKIAATAADVIRSEATRIVYIMSNHASHAGYAIESIRSGKATFIEKPVSVTREQFARLCQAMRTFKAPVYAGYNRPFSQAIVELRNVARDQSGPVSLNCFVIGHRIPEAHWYRDPREGTRICGNVGHWLDLTVHILSWEKLPDRWNISIAYSADTDRDDNLAISLVSESGDLVVIALTSRSEPFEGINETIVLQKGDVAAKIDDFRSMTVWKGGSVRTHRYWPKDVGHEAALLQPFKESGRQWREVELSTLLMLFIMDMVVQGRDRDEFSFSREWARIEESAALLAQEA